MIASYSGKFSLFCFCFCLLSCPLFSPPSPPSIGPSIFHWFPPHHSHLLCLSFSTFCLNFSFLLIFFFLLCFCIFISKTYRLFNFLYAFLLMFYRNNISKMVMSLFLGVFILDSSFYLYFVSSQIPFAVPLPF